MEDECFSFFHAWERRLCDVTKDRVVRPFEWGLDWFPKTATGIAAPPAAVIRALRVEVMAIPTRSFHAPPIHRLHAAARGRRQLLTFGARSSRRTIEQHGACR